MWSRQQNCELAKIILQLFRERICCQLSNGRQLQVSHRSKLVLHGVLMTLVGTRCASDTRIKSRGDFRKLLTFILLVFVLITLFQTNIACHWPRRRQNMWRMCTGVIFCFRYITEMPHSKRLMEKAPRNVGKLHKPPNIFQSISNLVND